MRQDARDMAVDLIFGVAFIALGAYLFAQRHKRIAIARERGHGIKSYAIHNTVAVALVLVGIYSIAVAFV
jgi:hypothetical protein